jgi:L-threonylcarbamoyladenylate synthase
MNKLIIFPTDTVYGIGCSIYDIYNIDKIYEIKKRDKSKPLACLCYDLEQIKSIAYVDDLATKLINKYLPGGLTLILKSKPEVLEKIGYETIGVRIPDCDIALNILKEFGPMLTTSVNDSGQTPINEYEEILKKYSDLVDQIYPPFNNSSNVSSTVIKIVDGKKELLREGTIKYNDILNV